MVERGIADPQVGGSIPPRSFFALFFCRDHFVLLFVLLPFLHASMVIAGLEYRRLFAGYGADAISEAASLSTAVDHFQQKHVLLLRRLN